MPIYNITDQKGTSLKIEGPSAPSEDVMDELFSDFYSEKRTVSGQVFETGKGIIRGFGSGFLTSVEGLGHLADAVTNKIGLDELIDSGDDNELVRWAKKGNESWSGDLLKADAAYQDTFATQFGEGLGSLASFMTPALAFRAAGYAGKVAQYGVPLSLASTQYSAEQAQRVNLSRQQGIEVDQNQADNAIILGALAGTTELAPIHRLGVGLFSKINKAAPAGWKKKLTKSLSSATLSGSTEAAQEVIGAWTQDAIERGIYNENLPKGQSYWDELKVGGAVGATADLLISGVIGRRNAKIREISRLKEEEGLRQKEDDAVSQAQEITSAAAQRQQDDIDQEREAKLVAAQDSRDKFLEIPDYGMGSRRSRSQAPQQQTSPAQDAVIPKGVKVGDKINIFDAAGNPYTATVTAVSELGTVRVLNQAGKDVILGYDLSATTVNVNNPAYTLESVGPSITNITGKTNAGLDGLSEPQLAELEIELEKRVATSSLNQQAGRAAVEDLNAVKLKRKNKVKRKTARTQTDSTSQTIDSDTGKVMTQAQINSRKKEVMNLYGKNIVDYFGASFPSNTMFSPISVEGNLFSVTDSQGNIYGKPLEDYESAVMLAGSLNDRLIDRSFTTSIMETIDLADSNYTEEQKEQLSRWGMRLVHPDFTSVSAAEIDSAAKTTLAEGYRENLSADEVMRRYPDSVMRGLGGTGTGLTASQTANRERLSKGLQETTTFSIQEAREILGEDFGNLADSVYHARGVSDRVFSSSTIKSGKNKGKHVIRVKQSDEEGLGSIYRDYGKKSVNNEGNLVEEPIKDAQEAQNIADNLNSRAVDSVIQEEAFRQPDPRWQDGTKKIEEVLEAKNIDSNINSPELSYIAESVTGNSNIKDMSPGEMRFLYYKIRSLPRFDVRTKLPVFDIKPYTKAQFIRAYSAVQESGKTDLDSIKKAAAFLPNDPRADRKAQAIKDALLKRDDIVKKESSFEGEEVAVNPRSLPVVYKDTFSQISTNLNKRLKDKYGLNNVNVSVRESLEQVVQDADGNLHFGVDVVSKKDDAGNEYQTLVSSKPLDSNIEGFYSPSINSIFLGIDRVDAKLKEQNIEPTNEARESALSDILDHEIVHATRRMDLWTQKEWSSLENLTKNRNYSEGKTFSQWAKETYPNDPSVIQSEEAVSEMIRYSLKDKSIITGKPRILTQRLFDFFERLGSAIQGTGFQNFSDILQKVESGEVGTRERGQIRTMRATESSKISPTKPDSVGTERIADFIDPDYVASRRSEDEINKAVEENKKATEESKGVFPFAINDNADPQSQYVARNPDKAFEVPFSMRERFSKNAVDDASDPIKKIADDLIARSKKLAGEQLLEDYSTTDNLKESTKSLRASFVNKYAAIEERNKRPEFINQMADTSAIGSVLLLDRSIAISGSSVKYGVPVYKNGATAVEDFFPYADQGKTKTGGWLSRRDDRGIIGLFSPLYDNQWNTDLSELAQLYAITIRAKELNKKGLYTPVEKGKEDEILAEIVKESNKYINSKTGKPVIEEWYNAYQNFNGFVIEFMRDTGVLNDETAERWKDSAYIPYYREAQDPNTAPAEAPRVFGGLTGSTQFKPVGKSEKAIDMPLLEGVTRNLAAAIDMGMKNVAQQRIIRDEVKLGLARRAKKGERLSDKYTIKFKVKGETLTYILDDPLLHEAMMGMGGDALEGIIKYAGAPARLLREMVTREPGFIIANMIRDTMSAWIITGGNFIPVVDTLRGFFKETETLEKLGVVGGYDYARDPKDINTYVARESKKRGFKTEGLTKRDSILQSTAIRPLTLLWDAAGSVTTRSDAATRRAVFDDVLARTGNLAEAQFHAMEVMNFSRRGSSPLMKGFTALVPFLNARIQGLDVLYRGATGAYTSQQDIKANRGKVALSVALRGLAIASFTSLYYSLLSDDEEYREAAPHIRDNNWLVPTKYTGLDSMIRIPIPFEVGVIFKLIPELIMRSFDDPEGLGSELGSDITSAEAIQSMKTQLISTFNISPTNIQAIKPLLETMTNHSFYTNREIVPIFTDRSIEKAFQKQAGTSEIAKGIGKQFDISPIKIDHLAKGYFGTIGSYVLAATDEILRDQEIDVPRRRLSDMPVIKRFFVSTKSQGLESSFYEMHDEIKKIIPTLNKLREQGRIEEAQSYLAAQQSMIAISKPVKATAKKLSALRKQRQAVRDSRSLTSDQKRLMIDQIESTMDFYLRIVPQLKELADRPLTNVGRF